MMDRRVTGLAHSKQINPKTEAQSPGLKQVWQRLESRPQRQAGLRTVPSTLQASSLSLGEWKPKPKVGSPGSYKVTEPDRKIPQKAFRKQKTTKPDSVWCVPQERRIEPWQNSGFNQ